MMTSTRAPRHCTPLLWVLALALAATAGSACSSDNATADATSPDTATGGTDDTTVSQDLAQVPETVLGDLGGGDNGAKDQLVLPDNGGGSDSGSGCPGGAGCPCSTTGDCQSGFCLDTPNGQQCAKTCPDSVCPTSYKCASVPSGSGDITNICVPAHAALCNPCTANSQCQGPGNGGARCVTFGNAGAFCGEACTTSNDCTDGYECADTKDLAGNASKQCIIKGGGACTCSATALKNELYAVCYKDTGSAKCAGKRICLADGKPDAPKGGGLTACLADVPEAEKCDGKDNDCDGQTDESACDDGSPCTDDNCDPKAGCSHTNNNGFCDADGSVCTKDDVCSNGKCLSGKPLNCDDNNPCTNDECDPKAGCKNTNADGLGCNFDDNDCTVGDSCKDGKCVGGPLKACATDQPCIEGKCNIVKAGKCEYKDKNGQACDDGNPCSVGEACVVDSCISTKAADCDDKNDCTIDTCDKKAGCSHTAASGNCDDGDKCTTKDACSNGKCDGTVLDAAKYCNDNNTCTSDTCNPAIGCVNKAQLGALCDDGNSCSVGDKCDVTGSCQPGSNGCACTTDSECIAKDDGNACNGTLFCDKSGAQMQCKIKPGSIVTCDVSGDNTCKKTVCDPAVGKCAPILQPEGLPCPYDDSVCTTDDGCKSGNCAAGKPLNCDDKNGCTIDTCDAKLGCKHEVQLTGPCDADGDACTVNDACKAGNCEAGAKKACDDNEICTADSCDSKTAACTNAQNPAQACSDGNECTVGDSCGSDAKSGKFTCLPGKGPNCDDNNPCTVDTCDGKTGCKNTIDGSLQVVCYSSDPKTQGKGICKPGVQSCDATGKAGPCIGQVLPEVGDPCDGKDNDCNGVADPGCAPGNWGLRFANADVAGKGPNMAVRVVVGGGSVGGGKTADGKWTINFGFLAWLKGWLGL